MDDQTIVNDDVPDAPPEGTSDTATVMYYGDAFSVADDMVELLETPSDVLTNNRTRFKFYTRMAYARGYVSEIDVGKL
jgi:hypothetical protein